MAILWTEDLSVGVKEIDNQHIELFKRVSNLLEACNQGKGKENVREVIAFLEKYVISHFGTEERYMKNYQYPDYISHKKQHDVFVNSFADLKNQFEKEGAGLHIVILTNRLVVDWLTDHIKKVDKLLGAFLKSQKDRKLVQA